MLSVDVQAVHLESMVLGEPNSDLTEVVSYASDADAQTVRVVVAANRSGRSEAGT